MNKKRYVEMNRLKRQIVDSHLFVVLGTKNYLHALKTNKENILYQVRIARKYNKPTLIIISKNLSGEDIIELEKHFYAHNVVKEMVLDLSDEESQKEVVAEIKKLAEEHENKSKKKEKTNNEK